VVEARRQVADAKSDAGRYRQTINRKRQKLETLLQGKPEYRAALVERNKAKAAYDAASRPALSAARETDQYLKAKAQWQSANAMATAAISGGPAALVELRSIRADMRQCESVVTELLANAVAADPGATETKAALDAAEAKLTAMREQHVDAALEDDPEYVSAAAQLKEAEARLETAEAQLAKAAQDSKDAKEQARLAYLAEQEAIRKARMAAPS
jgi:hypothetical protein